LLFEFEFVLMAKTLMFRVVSAYLEIEIIVYDDLCSVCVRV